MWKIKIEFLQNIQMEFNVPHAIKKDTSTNTRFLLTDLFCQGGSMTMQSNSISAVNNFNDIITETIKNVKK